MANPFDVHLDQHPLILAGPLVRRVQPDKVTVWAALKEPRAVTLRVYDPNDQERVRIVDVKRTVKLGENLHVIAVTACHVEATGPLEWGKVYLYNLFFAPRPAEAHTLSLAPPTADNLRSKDILVKGNPDDHELVDRLLYPARTPAGEPTDMAHYPLPSFVMPPAAKDLGNLRLIHASCRMPHGDGPDMLAHLDRLIGPVVGDPFERPQTLILTGDQIYADDVADMLLAGLRKVAKTLLGWDETLPDIATSDDRLKPGWHQELVEDEANFTAGSAARSHLLTLGEFCAMYLLAWSPVLWPPLQKLKGSKFELFPGEDETHFDLWGFEDRTDLKEKFDKQKPNLIHFLASLKESRRALANISSYMIFDDHEITDDWFLNLEWAKEVLETKLGRRIINNGLMAFAVFQAWGNTPDRFEVGTPGATLLKAVANWQSQHADQSAIVPQLGIPENSALEESGDLWPKDEDLAGVLRFDYTVDGPPVFEDVDGTPQQKALAYRIFVLNSRTGRQFATDDWFFDTSPAWLIGKQAFENQLNTMAIPETERSELAIVVSSAPIIGVPWVEKEVQDKLAFWGAEAFGDYEYWGLREGAVQRLFHHTAALGRVADDVRSTRAIILCGDVHYGFGARVDYDNSTSKPVIKATIAQFTASALKNHSLKPGFIHNHGYELDWIGDDIPLLAKRKVADAIELGACYQPVLLRMEPGTVPETPPGTGPATALGKQITLAKKHKFYAEEHADGKEVVGNRNLGEVLVEADGNGKPTATRQILHWYTEKTLLQTIYNVPFEFIDPECD